MNTHQNHTDPAPSVLLVPGHWLGAWAWDDVATGLRDRGLNPIALTLPGLDPDDPERAGATLSGQISWLRKQVDDQLPAPPVMVAHSGAGQVVSGLLDSDPAAIARVVYVDSGPAMDGPFLPTLPEDVAEVPLPPFAELGQQASLEGLDDDQLARFRARAVPMPGGVLREPLRLRNDARRDVPSTIVACSLPSQQMLAMAADGHPMFAEVARLTDLEVVDLPTGHWPMWSRPDDLAGVIAARVTERGPG
jgi:pimeloyl-ACP methyl ester carboxylesterase